jgi:predicted Zn-dependent protease
MKFASNLSQAALLALVLLGAAPAMAQREGVEVGGNSGFTQLVPAGEVEQASKQQYAQMMQEAASQKALAPSGHPQLQRLRRIAQRIIPHAVAWNPRARDWQWEVNLIGSQQINAFCMPGGKIAFFSGLIDQLNLSDAEIAIVMGHEMTHALEEHSVDQYKKQMYGQLAERAGVAVAAQIFKFDPQILGAGAHIVDGLMQLRFSRADETEADRIGLEIAARAGYDPHAGLTLWKKMEHASRSSGLQFLSSHPGGPNRIKAIQAELPNVMPLYQAAVANQRPAQ